MAGGSQAHAGIAVNAIAALYAALGDGPCLVYNSDLATRVSATRFTYADVVVACGEDRVSRRDESEIDAPRAIVEVLSESTERMDRGRKWDDYRQCESLQEYVLVGTEYQRVEVYCRTEQGWGLFHIYGPGDEVELTSIGVRFPLSALYRRTDVPETSPA
jgi:Uma2 family endonuclease